MRPDGASVVIDPSGKAVAEHMWDSVRSVTTYAGDLMEALLQTLGVPQLEESPFCRAFGSLADLRNEYVKYQARTFVFRGDCGVGPTGKNEDRGVCSCTRVTPQVNCVGEGEDFCKENIKIRRRKRQDKQSH